jgi:hypothetical protein
VMGVVAVAGDTVWIAPGTYRPTAQIRPARSGTATTPITYRAQPGGEVIVDGQRTLPAASTREGLFSVVNRSWIVVDGLRFINSGWAGVFVRYSDNVIVQNCSTFQTAASGIIAANSSHIRFIGNTVQRACIAANGDTNECITIASVNTFEVAYNTVFDRLTDPNNGGEGIDVKNASSNGSVHHNRVYDLFRVGINVASEEGGTVDRVRIHDNGFADCRNGPGIRLAGYLDNGPLREVDVFNTTVVRCGKFSQEYKKYMSE